MLIKIKLESFCWLFAVENGNFRFYFLLIHFANGLTLIKLRNRRPISYRHRRLYIDIELSILKS